MRYGFIVPKGDPSTVAVLAREAEEAGWDGVLLLRRHLCRRDGDLRPVGHDGGDGDGDEARSAGRDLDAPARRRPWKLARETMTLDHLSGGRLVLPVGLGALDDGGFSKVGEPTDRKVRAELLDESLEILTGLWSGGPSATMANTTISRR